MPSVVYVECRILALNAECSYAERHYAECHYAECSYAECQYAECHYAEYRYAECRGTVCVDLLLFVWRGIGKNFQIFSPLASKVCLHRRF